MSRIVIVSSADSAYAPLLQELHTSLIRHPQFKALHIRFAVIDAGLSSADKEWCLQNNIILGEGIWPNPDTQKRSRGREFLKACVSRPFIPQIFPNFDTYIWLDADTWVQNWRAIDWLLQASEMKKLAIAPQVDRAYGKTVRMGWVGPFPWKPRSFYYSNARRAFGGKIARQMFPYPVLNAGVFALAADAPHWAAWQNKIKQALKRGKVFTAEQLSLGVLIWLDGLAVDLLPATTNWLCETKPVWDVAQNMWVEPFTPHAPIGIMHLSGYDKMRRDKTITTDVTTITGEMINRSLRYQPYN